MKLLTTHRTIIPVGDVLEGLKDFVHTLETKQSKAEDATWQPFYFGAEYDPLRHESTLIVKGFTERDQA